MPTTPHARFSFDEPRALFVIVCAVGLLWVDAWVDLPGQVAFSAITWTVLLAIAARAPAAERAMLMRCLVIATAGELVLALGWGLYTYRWHNLPAFVPPGHVLVFMLGVATSRRVPWRALRWVGGLTALGAAVAAIVLRDELSALLALVLAVLWHAAPRERAVFCVMGPLTLALELCGTALGCWTWQPTVPGLGWHAANPPMAASAFYCLLDVLVLRTGGVAWTRPAPWRWRLAGAPRG